jgi:hypothetical protein
MAADITEEFQVDISSPALTDAFSDSIPYDIELSNLKFLMSSSDDRPYRRETAQYRKDQSDSSLDAGEHSLLGWWLRSQSSFHFGAGINYYEPYLETDKGVDNQTARYRFADSEGVNVWNQNEVTLLKACTDSGFDGTDIYQNTVRSIQWSSNDGVLLLDSNVIYKVASDGTSTIFHTGTDSIYDIADDGTNAYWVTVNAAAKWEVQKKPLSGDNATAFTVVYTGSHDVVNYATIEYVKETLLFGADGALYQYTGGTSATLLYTTQVSDVKSVAITASGTSVYMACSHGTVSTIARFTIDPDTLLLAPVGITAEMPRGEQIYSMYYYLGYVVIGTSRGVRIAQVLDDGNLVYGPLLFETDEPVKSLTAGDRFVWATARVNGKVGLKRIDLSSAIDSLIFGYANDIYFNAESAPVGVAFLGSTNRLAFASATNLYFESVNTYLTEGYLTTGKIRYNTLEDKLYKFIAERATYGGSNSIDVYSVDEGTTTLIYSGNINAGNRDNTVVPVAPKEYLAFKFVLRAGANESPVLHGYQLKALPAVKRQRLIQYPLMNFDFERDRFNNTYGYEGRAYQILKRLESLEEQADVIAVKDSRTGEEYQGIIEETSYQSTSSPDKRGGNFGGVILVTVRKI